MKRIWLLGMYDLSNYGDCLFPFVFSNEFEGLEIQLNCVSLTGNKSIFKDAPPSFSLNHAKGLIGPDDTLVIGGGNLICDTPLTFFEDKQSHYDNTMLGTDLWLRGLEVAKEIGCKTVINGAGAFAPLKKATLERWDKVKSSISYIAWRDISTWKIMGACATDRVIPDTTITAKLASLFNKEDQKVNKEKHILVNLRPRSLSGIELRDAANLLDQLSSTWQIPLFFHSNSHSHLDHQVSKKLASYCKNKKANPEEAKTIYRSFRSISKAELVLTSSMHTYITAASAECQVILLKRPRYNKFLSVEKALDQPGFTASSWSALQMLTANDERTKCRMKSKSPELEQHWNIVKQVIFS
jgi:hypothetical protein